MKLYIGLFTAIISVNSGAEKNQSDLTVCPTPPVKDAISAKCIALREGVSISLVGAFGGVWDVIAINNAGFWLIYPKEANGLVSLDTLLMKIEIETGDVYFQK